MNRQDQDICPFGRDVQNYWNMRLDLFSRFDCGIEVDREGLYSTKPEALALEIASLLTGAVVLDAFCGAGGSAIGLARAGKTVIAIDTNERRLEMARKNASVYGVHDQITFIHGDARDALRELTFDTVHFDPPWGGTDYVKKPFFRFADFAPPAEELLALAFKKTAAVAIIVPPNFDFRELSETGRDFFLHRGVLGGRHLFSSVFFGHKLERYTTANPPPFSTNREDTL
jgi:trimethylguanosine synthase